MKRWMWPQRMRSTDGNAKRSGPRARPFGNDTHRYSGCRRVRRFADVVVGTHEDQMVGIFEKAPDRLDFRRGRRLIGAERVEADDNDGVGVRNQRCVEQRLGSVVAHAFGLDDGIPRQCFGLFGEGGEIRLLDVVEEAADARIDTVAARDISNFG